MLKPTPALIAACLLVTSAQSQQHFNNDQTITTNTTSLLDTILARGYLKVGTTGDYKPFTYLVGNKSSTLPPIPSLSNTNSTNSTISTPYIGADITTAHSLSASLSLPHPIQFIPTTWSTLAADLAAEKFDVGMSGISITLPHSPPSPILIPRVSPSS
ncbi:periplasmic binding protein-like II [Stemphylium lycopersici]|nr:periplasmic binding protein-like II [Stemphylium lycopersici]